MTTNDHPDSGRDVEKIIRQKLDQDASKAFDNTMKPRETFVIDATMISTFRACEEKYRKRMEELLVSKHNNGAIGSGLAYHEAGATFRQARKAKMSLEESFNVGLFKLREAYPKHMPIEFVNGPIPDERRSLDNLERIFEAWCLYEAKQNFEYLYIEQSGGISLGSIERSDRIYDIVYSVIIDAVVRHQGLAFSDDIKTTTMNVTQAFKDSFRLSQQIMGYVIAAEALLGIPIYGGLVSISWFQKQGKAGSKPVDEYFHTVPVTFSTDRLTEWHTNTLHTVNRILDCKESGYWQMDLGDSCKTYNGCTYKEICWADPKMRPAMARMDFERATWTPLEEVRSRKIALDDSW